MHLSMNSETTLGVKVEAESHYVPDQSAPENSHYFFSYNIQVTNLRQENIQLIARYWLITDGHGRVQEVRGEGVVGLQPVIEPGQTFEYGSFCPLQTPTGMMKGTYEMLDASGDKFEVLIPEFFLIEPNSFN
jgi:ApaG protein